MRLLKIDGEDTVTSAGTTAKYGIISIELNELGYAYIEVTDTKGIAKLPCR